jgi:hypothetical protein
MAIALRICHYEALNAVALALRSLARDPMKLSRRQAFAALGLGAASAAFPLQLGCDTPQSPPPRRGPRSHAKTVHLAARGRSPLLERAAHLELRIGHRRIRGSAHSEDTLRAPRQALQGTPDLSRLNGATHYFERVPFSAEAAQSFAAYAIMPDGRAVLYAAGIHTPSGADRLRVAGDQTDPDPHHLLDDESCAIWAVFNSPHVMVHDADAAADVVAQIRATPDFPALVRAIGLFPFVVDPAGPDDPLYAGWLYGRYRTYRDTNGSTVYCTDIRVDGTDVLGPDGKPRRTVDWQLADDVFPTVGLTTSVRALVDRVTAQLMSTFNDRPSAYQDVKYFRYPAMPVAAQAARVTSGGSGDAGVGEEVEPFSFSAEGKTLHHRVLKVERKDGDRFAVSLDNYLALASLLGVSHFRADGTHLQTNVLGFAPSTYYPSLTRAFGAHASVEAAFSRPKDALTSNVWTLSSGFSLGDYGPRGEQVNFTSRGMFTWVFGNFFDFVLPGIFLSLGLVGAARARDKIAREILEEAAGEAGIDALVDLVFASTASLYNVGAGQPIGAVLGDLGADFGKVMMRLCEKVFLQQTFAGIVASVFAEEAVETELELAVPFVGWAVFAAELATTGVQLGFATTHLATNEVFTHGVVHYTHEVEVTLRPKGSTYFPGGIGYYKATVMPGSAAPDFTPIEIVASFLPERDADGFEVFEFAFAKVPIVAPFNLQVVLYDRDPNGAAHANARGTLLVKDITNVTVIGQAQRLEYRIETPPLPIDEDTELEHDVLLTPKGAAFEWSAAEAPAPTGDVDPVTCRMGTLCGILGVSVRQNETQRGRIAFNFRTLGPNGTAPVMAGVDMALSRAERTETVTVSASVPVSVGLRSTLMSLDGRVVVLSQKASEQVRVYLVPDSSTEFDATIWQETSTQLFATSRFTNVEGARLSPDGRFLLLASREGVEVIYMSLEPGASRDRRTKTTLVRPGAELGCLASVVSVAAFHREAQFAVLDTGNARVTVFDHAGNVVPYFKRGRGDLSLATGGNNQVYLDLDVDALGNVWVLHSQPVAASRPRYGLDVYSKSGERLTTFSGVEAERFALDRFNQVFTVNRQARPGPNGYAVPTLSRWFPTNP